MKGELGVQKKEGKQRWEAYDLTTVILTRYLNLYLLSKL
jgi:hypothetical protein